MSFVTSEYCGDDIGEYACSNMIYEHGENEFYEGYDGPYEHGNGALVYDGDSYEGYDGPWDNEQHDGENYYSGDNFEMNGTYDSCDDVEGMEEPYGVYHCGDEGSHATHHGYDGDVRYNSFSHRSYESFEQNIDRNGGCEVEFTTSSCATSYPKKEGINVWVGPFQSRHVDHRRSTFPTSQNMLTYSSHPSSNVSCSYGDEVEGRRGGTLSHEVVELRESFTTLREDFDDFLRILKRLRLWYKRGKLFIMKICLRSYPWKKNKILLLRLALRSILGSKPSEAPQNVKNHEVLESFQNEKMCDNVDSQGGDTSSYELQGNNGNAYTSLNLEHHCVAKYLLKDNLLFDDDMTLESVYSEMPYNVGSVATLSGY
ncbi:hypothetical protein H5410_061152 [Solanum commersonii]|uniref:Uncharacterized protein n=1 Tax=Solanum commersonii TaxID=4109 RepID=A0A9J5W780_SOLCO|nr:hypothetical protein H5410_061152 [Solanum commersonii]